MNLSSRFFRRMVKPYFTVIAVIVFAAMFIVYYAAAEREKNSTFDMGAQLAQRIAQQIYTNIDEMDLLARQVDGQPEIMNKFVAVNDEDYTNYFSVNVLEGIDMSSKLKNLLISRESSYNIVVYNGKGDFVSSREYMIDRDRLNKNMTPSEYRSRLELLSETEGQSVASPSKDRWSMGEEQYITLTRALQNSYSGEVYGIIEVRCSMEKLAAQISELSDGAVIELCGRTTGDVFFTTAQQDGAEYFSKAEADIENAPWTVTVKTANPLTAEFKAEMMFMLAVIYAVIMSLMLCLSLMIGKKVAQPITELTEHVRLINDADTHLDADIDGPDELKELERSFDSMLKRLKVSMQQEKKAYSLALQAQMNPHFLYNMLAVIGAAGGENGADEVEDMCVELSEMLRYVTEYQKVSVPLEEEAEHTEHYLSLMKSRYEEYFEYSIEIDEELKRMTVPKLCLQPLAENCFSHGFKTVEPPWKIEIRMRVKGRGWELEIRDNGSGIDEDGIQEIDEKIQKALNATLPSGMGGLGIASTVVRFKLTHDEEIGYEIYNDKGTVIKLWTK